MGFCSVARLKEKARGYGVSITEYLTAVLLKVIADKQHRERPRRERPVALAHTYQPAGLVSLGNPAQLHFDGAALHRPLSGEYTFEEVLSQVHHYLRLNINRQQMQAAIAGNVKFTTNRLLQIVPIVLKNPVMSLGYSWRVYCLTRAPIPTQAPSPCRRRWLRTYTIWR